jgi:hypothetical protein
LADILCFPYTLSENGFTNVVTGDIMSCSIMIVNEPVKFMGDNLCRAKRQ